MLPVWFVTLTRYPNARLPGTGILFGLDDAKLTCIITIATFPWKQVMDRLSSSGSTVPSLDGYFEQNMRNPILELLFVQHVSGIFFSYPMQIDLAKIALSCHFALDLQCYKEEVLACAR